MSFRVHRGVVPLPLVNAARRRLGLELRRCGVTADEVAEWSRASWWPSLRECPEIMAVQDAVQAALVPVNFPRLLLWAEPQILIRLPDEDDVELGPPHTDELPPWAGDQWVYSAIIGVELTDGEAYGGGTVLHLEEGLSCPILRAGDALAMDPELPHSGSPNHSGSIRMALFFRLLVQADGAL